MAACQPIGYTVNSTLATSVPVSLVTVENGCCVSAHINCFSVCLSRRNAVGNWKEAWWNWWRVCTEMAL